MQGLSASLSLAEYWFSPHAGHLYLFMLLLHRFKIKFNWLWVRHHDGYNRFHTVTSCFQTNRRVARNHSSTYLHPVQGLNPFYRTGNAQSRVCAYNPLGLAVFPFSDRIPPILWLHRSSNIHFADGKNPQIPTVL
jgi:hypothetical protein